MVEGKVSFKLSLGPDAQQVKQDLAAGRISLEEAQAEAKKIFWPGSLAIHVVLLVLLILVFLIWGLVGERPTLDALHVIGILLAWDMVSFGLGYSGYNMLSKQLEATNIG